jgi:hypothetical protein
MSLVVDMAAIGVVELPGVQRKDITLDSLGIPRRLVMRKFRLDFAGRNLLPLRHTHISVKCAFLDMTEGFLATLCHHWARTLDLSLCSTFSFLV